VTCGKQRTSQGLRQCRLRRVTFDLAIDIFGTLGHISRDIMLARLHRSSSQDQNSSDQQVRQHGVDARSLGRSLADINGRISLPHPICLLATSADGSLYNLRQAIPNPFPTGFCCIIGCGLPDADTADIEIRSLRRKFRRSVVPPLPIGAIPTGRRLSGDLRSATLSPVRQSHDRVRPSARVSIAG